MTKQTDGASDVDVSDDLLWKEIPEKPVFIEFLLEYPHWIFLMLINCSKDFIVGNV